MDQYDLRIGTILLALLALYETFVFVYAFSEFKVTATSFRRKILAIVKNGMTTGGYIFLALGWGFVTTLNIYCYRKLLSKSKP